MRDDLTDLLPDHLRPARPKKTLSENKAVVALQDAELKDGAVRLAQIVNLHIAGYSLTQIGASVGATAEEIDRLLQQDTARYVRSQPALRTYVRNWVSRRYLKMIEADWSAASDAGHTDKLEHQDRVMRMLDRMAKLHGAEAPTQTEVKVDAAPEAVEKLVAALAAGRGLGYDESVFDVPENDIVDAEVVDDEEGETGLDRGAEGAGGRAPEGSGTAAQQ